MNTRPEISIVLPCLDEAQAITSCLDEIRTTIRKNRLNAEVIVVDNNSTDGSTSLVRSYRARFPQLKLISEKREGYGSACEAGFAAARGKYLFMADADGTYKFSDIPLFITKLKEENDLVVGNRFKDPLIRKSMPWLHRCIGNPFLSFLVRLFFKVRIRDIHCGARALTKEAFDAMALYTTGMEFASEMIIQAAKLGLTITEIPIEYRPRMGTSKLHPLADGWRHLRFILLYSPFVLFFIPGATSFLLGAFAMATFYFFEPTLFGFRFYTHPMFLFSVLIILGYQLMLFAGFSKVYAVTHLGHKDRLIEKLFRHITIEKTGLLGIVIAAVGIGMYCFILVEWVRSEFGSLYEIKNSVVALTFFVLGIQTFFAAFMFSILGIKQK